MNMADKTSLSWRSDSSSRPRRQSKGIPPSNFHKQSKNRSRSRLQKTLAEASSNVVRQQRRQVSTNLKLQRAAFKEVTSLKTWPLQELALQDFSHWTMVHLGSDLPENKDVDPDENHGDSTGLSSSSLEEAKRVKRKDEDGEQDLSPRKSTLRHQFKLEFIRERDIKSGLSLNDDDTLLLQPALWCMEPRIFSVEKSNAGKRKYIVGHLGRFLDYYWRKCDPKQRHYYELIREHSPCRLYFDLEFSKQSNPTISEEASEKLIQEFIEELCAEMHRHYAIVMDPSHVVDLDSSTPKKFSRHLIVHLPNQALFADTAAVGRVVKVFVGRLAEEQATGGLKERRPVLAQHLFVNVGPTKANPLPSLASPGSNPSPTNQESETSSSSPQEDNTAQSQESNPLFARTCFVDLGVYTRNRLFRVLGSTKFGKPASAALRIADANRFPFPEGFTNESFYIPAMQQDEELAVKKESKEKPKELNSDIKAFSSAIDFTIHAEALAATLVVPMNASKIDYPILDDSKDAKALETNATDPAPTALAPRMPARSNASSSLKMGSTPYPQLDDFVLSTLAIRGGVQGTIRGWSIDSSADGVVPRAITYQMSRNRWCECIQRPHKSNNIMWTVDLNSMQCVQGCHDPACRALRFRGTPVDVPPDIAEVIRDELFEQQLALMDEKELLKAKSKQKQQPMTPFDEASFEKALMALNLNGKTPKKQTDGPTSSKLKEAKPAPISPDDVNEPAVETQNAAETSFSGALDDDALVAAAMNNPELFP